MAEEYDSLLELYKESIRLFRDVSDIEKVSLGRIWSGVHGLSCLLCMNSFLSNSCVFAHIYTTRAYVLLHRAHISVVQLVVSLVRHREVPNAPGFYVTELVWCRKLIQKDPAFN